MQKRILGKTGRELSIVGFGGIVVKNETPESAARIVAEAVERGVNYFDVAPSYGNAEERLGPALKPYRDSVFLACKTQKRTAVEAAGELNGSLARLCTDHVDLYQFHAVNTAEDVERIFAPGGAMTTFKLARDKGQVCHIGFSTHSEEAASMMLDRFPFETVLFPVNFACWLQGNFGPKLNRRATELGIGILAIKSLCRRPLAEGEERPWRKCWYVPLDDPEKAEKAFRFTLSRPVTAAVSPGHIELLRFAMDAADRFIPMTAEEEKTLVADLDGKPLFTSS
jgi:aryl-alcohol dehydrogenase-like predicted oxidoreductase